MKKALLLICMLVASVATMFAQSELTRYPVFEMGEDGSQYYRIPALVQAADGSLVAIADKRGSDLGDLPNIISVVAKRSTDGGKTWSEMVTIAQGDKAAGNTYGDAAAVLDEETGKIITVFVGNENYGNNCVGLWASNSSYPLRLYQSESSDNGVTWTKPVDITNTVYGAIYGGKYAWIGMFAGSGSAVQLKKGPHAGRIMFVVAARNDSSWGGAMSNYAVFSDDNGATWQVSQNAAYSNGDEAKIVELSNGDLLMSIKNRNKGNRLMARSTDGGLTWEQAKLNTNLMDPGCNGDVVSYTHGGVHYLLHSLPGSSSTRENVTVYLSADNGETWDIKRQVYSGYSAYSTLQVLADGTIGIIVEEGKWDSNLQGKDGFQLAYYNFTLDWLLDGKVPDVPLAEGVLDLNGSRYMSIANDEAFNIAAGGEAGFTVSCKVKLPEFQAGKNMRFVNNRAYEGTANSGTTGFDLYGGNSAAQSYSVNLSYDGKPWGNSFAWASGVAQDEWAHLTWVLDGTTSYIYINGELKETKTGMSANGMPSKKDILVGAGYTNVDGQEVAPTYFTIGYIDDVRFYNKALTAEQVAADMTTEVGADTEGLIAAYDFANIEGTNVEDISGNGHNGTLVGFPEEVQYTVTVTATEGGTATVNGETGSALVWDGKSAVLEATPDAGYKFSGWLVDEKVVSVDNPYTIEVTEDITIVARFVDENALEYDYVDGNSTNGNRKFDKFTITDGTNELAIEGIQADNFSPIYADRTASVLVTEPGARISFSEFKWDGQWMHAYGYIDYALDGSFNSDANPEGTTDGELVTYNFYRNGKDSGDGLDIWGNVASAQYANSDTYYDEDFNESKGLPHFFLPADLASGDYRMRIKIDWDNIDAMGDKDIKQNGGCQVDFIIRIEGPVDYTPSFTGEKTRSGRDITAVSLSSVANGDSKYSLDADAQKQCYVDATETQIFKVAAGEEVYPVVETGGSWVHFSVYVDVDADGFTAGIAEGSDWQPTGDLVSYSFYNNGAASDNYGWNSVGDVITGNDRDKPELPAFVAPTVPGTYRMRYQLDWCSIDPMGDQDGKFGDFMENGGQIVDVMLEVSGEEPADEATVALIKDVKDLLASTPNAVGYPAEAPRATLQAAVEAAEASPTAEAGSALKSAVSAYYATTDIILPEAGKAYTFTAMYGGEAKYVINAVDGALTLVEPTEVPESAKFVCSVIDGDYNYQFKTSDDAYYLAYPTIGGKAWLDNESETGLESDATLAVTKLNVTKILAGGSVAATNADLFGLVRINGYRGYDNGKNVDMFGPFVVKHSAGVFDGAGDAFYNENFTSAFRVEEVEVATAIEDVKVENVEQVIYDLTGRKVNAITAKGVYIVNGKKVLVK